MRPSPGAKPVRQNRSAEKRDRILEALDGLLLEREFDAIRVTEIAERAGLSAATIYQRFSNKDASLSILIELYIQRSKDWALSKEGRVDYRRAPDLHRALSLVARSAWRQVEAIGYVMRPAYLYSRLRPELLGPVWQKTEEEARAGFAALVEHFREEVGSSRPAKAELVMDLYNFMLLGKLLHGESRSRHFRSERAFTRALADLAFSYVTSSSSRQAPA